MESTAMISELLANLTVWHWLGLGLVLLVIEMTVGTYDLLWVSVAAFLTAVFKVLPLPEAATTWQGQLIFFAAAGIVLVIIGRTVFASWRKPSETHPTLNKRSESLVGTTGKAVATFVGGKGRVKIGDTIWSAVADTDQTIHDGMTIQVSGADSTVLKVTPMGR